LIFLHTIYHCRPRCAGQHQLPRATSEPTLSSTVRMRISRCIEKAWDGSYHRD